MQVPQPLIAVEEGRMGLLYCTAEESHYPPPVGDWSLRQTSKRDRNIEQRDGKQKTRRTNSAYRVRHCDSRPGGQDLCFLVRYSQGPGRQGLGGDGELPGRKPGQTRSCR